MLSIHSKEKFMCDNQRMYECSCNCSCRRVRREPRPESCVVCGPAVLLGILGGCIFLCSGLGRCSDSCSSECGGCGGYGRGYDGGCCG